MKTSEANFHPITTAFWYWPVAVLIGIAIAYIGAQFSPMLALAAGIGVCGGMILLRYPELGLLITVAIIPIERFGRFTDDNTEFTISLMRIIGIATLGVLVIHKLTRKKQFTIDKTLFLYGAYAFLAILSVTYTTDTLGTVRAASSIIANLMFLFVLINLTTHKKLVFQSLLIWLAVSVAIAVYSTYDWHLGSGQDAALFMSGDDDPGKGVQTTENRWSTIWVDKAELETLGGLSLRRTMGSTSHSAVYGINLIMTLPFFLFLLRYSKNRLTSMILWGSLAVICYNILLTNTRATILLAMGVAGLCVFKGLHRVTLGQVGLGLVGCIALILVLPEDIFNRILDISNYSFENSASLQIRLEYIYAGTNAFLDNWLFGLGVSNENIIPDYINSWSNAPEKTTAHNIYLQTLMELGILGFACLFGFAALLLRYSIVAARNFRAHPDMQQEYWFMVSTQITMIAVLIYGLQVDVFHFPLKGWWMLAGFTILMYHYSKRLKTPSTDAFSFNEQTKRELE
ncbi:O-antigen ligase family protein [Glaciecola sp. 1036]|uniref:O-antigen ligase family protein n=1 Tax=Alteromonadaceae TaxID=72275 RepID=UPI003CFF8F50